MQVARKNGVTGVVAARLWGGEGFESGASEGAKDGGRFSLGVNGSSIEQQYRTDFCALKCERDSFNLATSFDGKRITYHKGTKRRVFAVNCYFRIRMDTEHPSISERSRYYRSTFP